VKRLLIASKRRILGEVAQVGEGIFSSIINAFLRDLATFTKSGSPWKIDSAKEFAARNLDG